MIFISHVITKAFKQNSYFLPIYHNDHYVFFHIIKQMHVLLEDSFQKTSTNKDQCYYFCVCLSVFMEVFFFSFQFLLQIGYKIAFTG